MNNNIDIIPGSIANEIIRLTIDNIQKKICDDEEISSNDYEEENVNDIFIDESNIPRIINTYHNFSEMSNRMIFSIDNLPNYPI
jgi:hypothetical protein